MRRTAALLVVLVALAGCDSALDRPSGPTGSAAATTAPTTTTVAITPITPDGLLSGPGVTDDSITVGMLVDPDRDRGFTAGVELWQQAVNTSGGLCGRSLELIRNGSTDVPTDVVQAYDTIGRRVVGLITLAPPTEAVALNSRISADQIPALTPAGTAAQLGPSLPVVIGPTQDILSINALDYLDRSGRIEEGATIGVLTDGSAAADNALAGATWWADQRDITLEVRTVTRDAGSTEVAGSERLTDWGSATHVLALTDATTTGELVAATPADLTVVTMIDSYNPTSWSSAAAARDATATAAG